MGWSRRESSGTLRRAGRRRLLWLLALGLVVTLATSCFGGNGGPAPTAPSSSVGASASEGAAEASASPTASPDPAPEAGDCRNVSVRGLRSIVNDDDPVRCRRPHTVFTFYVGRIPARAAEDALSSADENVENAADRICKSRFNDFVGGTGGDRRLSMLTPTYFLPSTEQFTIGARWVRCDIYAYATPDRLLRLPTPMKNALERPRVRDAVQRCSPVSPSAANFGHVACQRPHHWRAVAIRPLGKPREDYPGPRTVQNRAQDRCEAPVRSYLDTQGAFSYGFEVPRRKAWSEGDRIGLCWARTNG